MIFGLILYMAFAALFFALGYLLWKKQKINLIHDYHYRHVNKSDIPQYCRLMGLGMFVMGFGFLAAGVIAIIFEAGLWCTIIVTSFLVLGLLIFNKAQKKYNGSWFS